MSVGNLFRIANYEAERELQGPHQNGYCIRSVCCVSISCNAAAQRWMSLKIRCGANKIISHRSLANICQEDDVGTAVEAFVCDKNIVDTQASHKPGASHGRSCASKQFMPRTTWAPLKHKAEKEHSYHKA
eukprot:scaffold4431_cov69-Skeletonema_dohrnii-CCMP3373.AAC.2